LAANGAGRVKTFTEDAVGITELTDEHDLTTEPEIGSAAYALVAVGPVVFDLTQATFVDSSTIGRILITLHATRNERVAVAARQDGAVGRVLHLMDMPELIPTFERRASCLGSTRLLLLVVGSALSQHLRVGVESG
jgi:anti-anti-sigma regulatory factor